MKNRKWFQASIAGVLSAAMLTTSVSVWGAEFSDGAAAEDAVVVAAEIAEEVTEEVTEEAVEEEVPEIELFSADEARASEVSVSKTYFPDSKFRAYVSEKIDEDKNGKLSAAELKGEHAVTVDLTGLGVTSLKGIERLPYAKNLFASRNKLKAVDLTKNSRLQIINLDQNALEGTLDLRQCTNMTIVKYSNNKLTRVLMPSYKYMKNIDFIDASHNLFPNQSYAGLKYIDSAYMPALTEVNASFNKMTSFDCSGFQGFLDLSCNRLTYLTGGRNGYQATGLYLEGKYNTLSKTKVVDFSVLGNSIPQRLTYNPSAKSKFKVMTPKLSIKTAWDKITLTVNCSADDAKYVLQKKAYGASSYQTIATWAAGELDDPEFGENQYVDTNISAGEKYVYKLTTYVKIQNGDKKDVEWSAYTGSTVYAAPAAPSIALKSSKTGYANISWNAVEGADGYQVYYGTSASSAKYAITKGTSRLYYNKSGIRSGRTYYFRVRAFKKVNGTTVYGPFCTAKPLKIK